MSTKTPTAVELRSELTALGEKIVELREKPKADRGDGWASDIRQTTSQIYAADALLVALESQGPTATRGNAPADLRTPGEIFTATPGLEEWVQRGAHGTSPSMEVELRALLSTVDGTGAQVLLPKGSPTYNPGGLVRRRLFVRDLISPGQTTLNSIPFVRELNAAANELGADAVAEGAVKPEVIVQFEAADAPVRTIAAWIPVTTQVVEDVPTLRSYIDGRLGYMVMLREEEQIIRGTGAGANLRGIYNTVGIQTQAAVAAPDRASAIGKAIGKIENVDGEASGVAINPVTFWEMQTTRYANQFDAQGSSVGNTPFGEPPSSLWGLPAIRTRAVVADRALVADWRSAQVFDRSTVQIKVSDSHASYFIENKLVILAESRLAFAMHRPDHFVDVTLPVA